MGIIASVAKAGVKRRRSLEACIRMSGLASCGRGMLRRSISNSGLLVEISKHVAEQCEGALNLSTVPEDSQTPIFQDLLCDLRSLDSAVRQMETVHNDTHKMMDHLGSIVKLIPSNCGVSERSLPESVKSVVYGNVRNNLVDSPTFSSFQKEYATLRHSNEASNTEAAHSGGKGLSGDAAIRAQLEEARASNLVMQRALAAVQVRKLCPFVSHP